MGLSRQNIAHIIHVSRTVQFMRIVERLFMFIHSQQFLKWFFFHSFEDNDTSTHIKKKLNSRQLYTNTAEHENWPYFSAHFKESVILQK